MTVNGPLTIKILRRRYDFRQKFVLGDNHRTQVETIEVQLSRMGRIGRGECVPNPRYGESLTSVATQISQLPSDFTRRDLPALLRPGPARNAVDCALWDLEAKLAGKPVWVLADQPQPKPVETMLTLSFDEPASIRAQARAGAHHRVLKLRVDHTDIMPHLEALHMGAPDARIVLDAGESWTVEEYQKMAPRLKKLNVVLIEQPVPAGRDAALERIDHVIPICADESSHDSGTLARVRARYDAINIKLDKAGGLTHALALRDAALASGMMVMVGSMMASSLAMAPAILAAQKANFVDLDGPLVLVDDREVGLQYEGSWVYPPRPELWG